MGPPRVADQQPNDILPYIGLPRVSTPRSTYMDSIEAALEPETALHRSSKERKISAEKAANAHQDAEASVDAAPNAGKFTGAFRDVEAATSAASARRPIHTRYAQNYASLWNNNDKGKGGVGGRGGKVVGGVTAGAEDERESKVGMVDLVGNDVDGRSKARGNETREKVSGFKQGEAVGASGVGKMNKTVDGLKVIDAVGEEERVGGNFKSVYGTGASKGVGKIANVAIDVEKRAEEAKLEALTDSGVSPDKVVEVGADVQVELEATSSVIVSVRGSDTRPSSGGTATSLTSQLRNALGSDGLPTTRGRGGSGSGSNAGSVEVGIEGEILPMKGSLGGRGRTSSVGNTTGRKGSGATGVRKRSNTLSPSKGTHASKDFKVKVIPGCFFFGCLFM